MVILVMGISFGFAQNKIANPSEIYDFMRNSGREINFTDIENLKNVGAFQSTNSGVAYNYFKQTYSGTPIYNSHITVALKNGQIQSVQSNFIEGINQMPHKNSVGINAGQIEEIAVENLGYTLIHPEENNHSPSGEFDQSTRLYKNEFPAPKLTYFLTEFGELILSYEMIVHVKTDEGPKILQLIADASNGTVLHSFDTMLKCSFEQESFSNPERKIRNEFTETFTLSNNIENQSLAEVPQYRVFALPTESLLFGGRTLVLNPSIQESSPFGWHSEENIANYHTTTLGSNVVAMYDHDSEKYLAYINGESFYAEDMIDGGSNFNFDFPLNLESHPNESKEAAITNLFYMNNILHDIFYKYGFDEPAGNFQFYNHTGLGVSNDGVIAVGQTGESIGELGNAFFYLGVDGTQPMMGMFLYTPTATGGPIYDLLEIHTEGPLQGIYSGAIADFGPLPDQTQINAGLVIMEDTNSIGNDNYDGCDAATNPGEIQNKLAVVRRGSCTFIQKALNAQNAGALGLVIVNNVPGALQGGMGGLDPSVNIPSILITKEDGDPLISALESETLEASIPPDNSDNFDFLRRDSSIDNGVITHEFGHGVSSRLTGGANNWCLTNLEQMGEGWSDFFGLMMTMKPGDLGSDSRGMGNYLLYSNPGDTGIRPTAYSTDMTINPSTYATLSAYTNEESPHRLGYVWATMLWEMNWNLINKYGFNPDILATTGGNNKALQLVVEGLKLQTCLPGFVDGRNAILEADELLYNGENKCEIWRAFSKRGLGYYADQGSSANRLDGTANFDMPPTEVLDCSSMSVNDFTISIAQIYPNPTTGKISITTKENYSQISALLLDFSGSIIQTQKLNMNGTIAFLDISDKPAGVYILRIVTEKGNQSFKIIKQ